MQSTRRVRPLLFLAFGLSSACRTQPTPPDGGAASVASANALTSVDVAAPSSSGDVNPDMTAVAVAPTAVADAVLAEPTANDEEAQGSPADTAGGPVWARKPLTAAGVFVVRDSAPTDGDPHSNEGWKTVAHCLSVWSAEQGSIRYAFDIYGYGKGGRCRMEGKATPSERENVWVDASRDCSIELHLQHGNWNLIDPGVSQTPGSVDVQYDSCTSTICRDEVIQGEFRPEHASATAVCPFVRGAKKKP